MGFQDLRKETSLFQASRNVAKMIMQDPQQTEQTPGDSQSIPNQANEVTDNLELIIAPKID